MKRTTTPAKPAPAPAEEIMTVPTLAEFLRCDQSTIYRLLKKRKIPAFKLGSDWRFWRSNIERWISDMEVKPEVAGKGRPPKSRR